MKVHFKGTRGSIPTAPDASDIREKVVAALLAARGKDLRSESQIREFVETDLPFHFGSSYGGNTPCVHIDTASKDWLIFDGGSGIRVLSKEILEKGLTNQTFQIFPRIARVPLDPWAPRNPREPNQTTPSLSFMHLF